MCGRDAKRAVTVLSTLSTCCLLPGQPLPAFAVQFLNGIGDLLDLVPALTPRANSSTEAATFRMPGMGHCTALIKVRLSLFGSCCEGALGKHYPGLIVCIVGPCVRGHRFQSVKVSVNAVRGNTFPLPSKLSKTV